MYISDNKKVAAPCFNISRESCDKEAPCYKENWCYYAKFERMYKNVKPCLERNYKATMRKDFVNKVNEYLAKKKPRYFRIHSCGDFYSSEYVWKWRQIALSNPETIFVAYTYNRSVFESMPLPRNMRISLSIKLIFSKRQVKKYRKFCKSYIESLPFRNITLISDEYTNCPAQKDKSKKCFRDCFKCAGKGNVIIFKKH